MRCVDRAKSLRRLLYLLIAFSVFVWIVSTFPLYKGDGTLTNHGLFRLAGYRHEIVFDSFLLEKENHKVYKFSGVPHNTYVLKLNVIPNKLGKHPPTFLEFEPVLENLDTNGTAIELRLVANGKDVIHIEQAAIYGNWVVSSWSFWNQSFDEVPLSKYSQYELDLVIKSTGTLSEPVVLQPSLHGGYKVVF